MVQYILRVCSLASGVNCLAPQVSHRVDAVPFLQNIEHPQSVDRQHLNGPIAFGVQIGSHVGSDGGHIGGAIDQGIGDLIVVRHNSSVQSKWGVCGGAAGSVAVHQISGPDAGRTAEDHKVDLRNIRRAGNLLGRVA